MLYQIFVSLTRLAVGHSIGYAIGLGIALLAFNSMRTQRPLVLFASLLAPIPIVAWLPFFIAVTGIGDASKIACVAVPTSIIIFFFSLHGFNSVEERYWSLAKLGGFSRWRSLHLIMLPHSASIRGIGQRLALFIGWFALVIVERALGNMNHGGIGYTILKAYELSRKEQLWYACGILALSALALDLLLSRFHSNTQKWRTV